MLTARILATIVAAALAGACSVSLGDDDTPPPHHEWSACEVTSDCVLAAAGCCDACGRPALADVDAVNRGRVAEHFAAVCPAPVPCPECASIVNPDLHATCSIDGCVAVDIRALGPTTCTVDADCRLRTTGCCECGGSTEPWALTAIAITGEPAYRDLACDPDQTCPRCAPIYPESVRAICAPDGHCAVAEAARSPATSAAE
jgi:hypothetical protein